MRKEQIFELEASYREPMRMHGFTIGDQDGARSCAIVGSLRGNEVQQTFICANLVSRLCQYEREGRLCAGKGVIVIPCANPFSMNAQSRFWPTDGTDVNRRFPGDAKGETTERIAAAIMDVVGTYELGIQLSSFNQEGDFLPHVRITRQGPISDESVELARDFGLPYVLVREPLPFDRMTLNYAWQGAGTHAFSLYSKATDRIDVASEDMVVDAIIRFLEARGIVDSRPDDETSPAAASVTLREPDLVEVRTQRSSGYFVTSMQAGMHVSSGQWLADVLDAFDAHVVETLVSPCSGHLFFMRVSPMVQQHMVVFRIAPSG